MNLALFVIPFDRARVGVGLRLGRNSILSPKIVKWLNDVEITNSVTSSHQSVLKKSTPEPVQLAVRDETIGVPTCCCGWRRSLFSYIFDPIVTGGFPHAFSLTCTFVANQPTPPPNVTPLRNIEWFRY